MKPRFRIHCRIQEGNSPLHHWTFDNPERVSIGFGSEASIWIFDPEAGSETGFFERVRGETRLRVGKDRQGHLLIDGQPVPLTALREAGVLKADRRGEFISLREKSTGAMTFGGTKVEFWVTPAPKDPEYPTHCRFLAMLRDLPYLFLLFAFLATLGDLFLLRLIQSLPPSPEPTLAEVNTRFNRLWITTEEYSQIRMKQRLGKSSSTPPEAASEIEKPRSAPKPLTGSAGFLKAVASARSGGKNSPFSGLFTTSSLAKDLDVASSGKNLDQAIAESLKGSGSLVAAMRNSPDTIGIGAVHRPGAVAARLDKEASLPTVPRLSYEIASTQAGIDRNELERVVASRAGELRDCYERALSKNPALAGKVVFSLILRPAGDPLIAVDDKSTLKDTALAHCAVSRMVLWPFPRPPKDSAPVILPFIFSPASKG
jgi:hypothetical protein